MNTDLFFFSSFLFLFFLLSLFPVNPLARCSTHDLAGIKIPNEFNATIFEKLYISDFVPLCALNFPSLPKSFIFRNDNVISFETTDGKFFKHGRRGVLYEYNIRGEGGEGGSICADARKEKDGEGKKFKGFDNSSPALEFDSILFQFSVIDG